MLGEFIGFIIIPLNPSLSVIPYKTFYSKTKQKQRYARANSSHNFCDSMPNDDWLDRLHRSCMARRSTTLRIHTLSNGRLRTLTLLRINQPHQP